MQNKRVYDISIAINRIKNYCAIQDRCQWDVQNKLHDWGLQQTTKDHILEILINNQFIDEQRFAFSFARGKFRIKNWGKYKIIRELKRRKISSVCIEPAIKAIDEDEYIDVLKKLFYQKNYLLKENNLLTRRKKIAKFLIQRGFEANLVWEEIRALGHK
tara:strand:- start:236 stop:712 length:477 start_codon:yes stop_codon:yes gene_type:complete